MRASAGRVAALHAPIDWRGTTCDTLRLAHLSALTAYLPILALWCAVCCTVTLVLRELGLGCLKKYPLTALVLFLSLASFPAAGLVKLSRPYRARILSLIRRDKSPAILGLGCPFFPPDNIWNRRALDLPVDVHSQAYIESMGPGDKLHADFGGGGGYRYVVSDGSEPAAEMAIDAAGESDRGPYRLPDNAPIEEGSEGHVLVLDSGRCLMYELFGAAHTGPHQWSAGSAAIFDLRSNRLRPAGWTAADAAGMSVLVGLARYDEVEAGHIGHALRFTTRRTRRTYVWPARHFASSSSDPNLPPMGQRFRLRAGVDISRFSPQTRVILTALKEYGMILADNGGNWYISGSHDSRWAAAVSRELATLHGIDLEAVDQSGLMLDPDSGQARQ